MQADVPGLYAPLPVQATQAAEQEAVFTAPDEEGLQPDPPQPSSSYSATHGAAQSTTGGVPVQPAPGAKPASDATLATVPTFRSRRRVVALDVVVADAKGHPIKEIPQREFVVKEDGKPQSISYFNEVTAGASVPTPQPVPRQDTDKKPRNIFSNDSTPQAPNAVTLILYDLLNTPAPEQQRARLELLNFIQHKRTDERFALCTLSQGLQMIQGFTPDENILSRALKNSKESLAYSSKLGQDASDRMVVDWLQQSATKTAAQAGAPAGISGTSLLDSAGRREQEAVGRRSRDLETRMAFTMDAFTQLARYLSALPGRKSLIWLSGSFPLGTSPGMDFRNPHAGSSTNIEQMKQAVNLLAESHVAVYPVDVKGLTSGTMTESIFTGGLDPTQPAGPPTPASNNQVSTTQRFDELSNLNAAGMIGTNLPGNDSRFMEEMIEHGIMDRIAADTGGKAFYNANGIEQAMSIAMEQGTNYYAVSYTPMNKKYDAQFRRIGVSLASGEKKYHVIHRAGYFAVDPDAPSALSKDATTGFGLAAMQHDAPQSRQLLFKARVVPIGNPMLKQDSRAVHPAKKNKEHQADSHPAAPIEMQHYEIDYAVTPSQLGFEPTADGLEHGAMNFMVASFGPDGSVQTSIASHLKGDLNPETYQDVVTGGFRLHQEVDVPVAAATLRMGVQDAINGRIGTIEIPLPVPAPPRVEQSRGERMPEIEPD